MYGIYLASKYLMFLQKKVDGIDITRTQNKCRTITMTFVHETYLSCA